MGGLRFPLNKDKVKGLPMGADRFYQIFNL